MNAAGVGSVGRLSADLVPSVSTPSDSILVIRIEKVQSAQSKDDDLVIESGMLVVRVEDKISGPAPSPGTAQKAAPL